MNNPNSDQLSTEFKKLVQQSFDRPLVDSEVRALEETLKSSESARVWYANAVQLHADLVTHSEAQEMCRRAMEEFPEAQLTPQMSPSPSRRKGWRRLSSSFHSASRLSIAASVLAMGLGAGCGVGLLAGSMLQFSPQFVALPWTWSVDQEVVAKIVSTHEAKWQASRVPDTLPTQGVRIGQRVRLESGLFQLAFRNGESLILEGPALFEVRSVKGGKLFSGKATLTAPESVSSFIVATPAGQLRCGPGQYGIEVRDSASMGQSEFHAIDSTFLDTPTARFVSNTGSDRDLSLGEAIRVGKEGEIVTVALAQNDDFVTHMPAIRRTRFKGDSIPLGNLFDDSKNASLTEAVRSDTYQAAGEIIDLAVAAVHDGGLDVDVSLAEGGVEFNFSNVGGGGPRVRGLPSNDTYRSCSSSPIRTTGVDFLPEDLEKKCEDGVGMSTNELLTFDLDELRAAGQLGQRTMRFVVDRAGLNDREPDGLPDRSLASARFIVIVSTTDEVLSGHVDGQRYEVSKLGDVFAFNVTDADLPPVLGRDGNHVAFDVPIPANARYLTLATGMHDVEHDDHAVFSGARIELGPDPSDLVVGK